MRTHEVSSITLLVNEVKRRAEALSCNNVAGKPEGRNGTNKTVSAISLILISEMTNKTEVNVLAPNRRLNAVKLGDFEITPQA